LAFGLAARAQQVRCVREGSRLRATTRSEALEAESRYLQIAVERRTVGLNRPLTLYVVTMRSPGWREPIVLHSGLLPWTAHATARRLREHLGLQGALPADQ
jgi:hypothetical protein